MSRSSKSGSKSVVNRVMGLNGKTESHSEKWPKMVKTRRTHIMVLSSKNGLKW